MKFGNTFSWEQTFCCYKRRCRDNFLLNVLYRIVASPDMFVNRMTFSFSQFITYHRHHSLFGCVSWQELFFLAWEMCLSSEADNGMYIVSSSVMRVVFGGWLFLAAFCYFSIILFRAAMVFGEELNLNQGPVAMFQAHNLSLHHLHDLPNESVSAGCPNDLCIGLHLVQISSVAFHTFLGRILVLISCRAWHVCELLHCNVVIWCYGSWHGPIGSLLSRHSAPALHTTSDVLQLPGQCRLDYNIWGYACS